MGWRRTGQGTLTIWLSGGCSLKVWGRILVGSSAWTLTCRPAVLWVSALDCVASRWLFAGLALGAGWTGEGVGLGVRASQLSLLLCFFPLVFLLPFSGNKAKEEKVKRASTAWESSRRTEMLGGAVTPQDGYGDKHFLWWASPLSVVATTFLCQPLQNAAWKHQADHSALLRHTQIHSQTRLLECVTTWPWN